LIGFFGFSAWHQGAGLPVSAVWQSRAAPSASLEAICDDMEMTVAETVRLA
jgi:hypothetical protein